jgi:periplasmic protein TonB
LQATIDTKGNLANLKVLQGDPILVKAAVDAVKKWKYRPYILKGEPVDVDTTIKIQFHL